MTESESRYQRLFDGVPVGLYQFTPDWRILEANPALVAMLGYPDRESLCQTSAVEIYAEPEELKRWQALIEREGVLPAYELKLRRRDGEIIWIENNGRVVKEPNSGQMLYYEGSMEDITARKRAEEQLLHDAFHDTLTGLPNRALFVNHLKLALERAKRHDDLLFALLFLDLDRFKLVNDSLGHGAGDKLLIAVAQKLKACVRPEDTVARLGGDEFAILLNDIADLSAAIHVAERIQKELSAPIRFGGHEVFTSASIGIALSSTGYERTEDILRDADIAMYRAKSQGQACYEVFDKAMHARALAHLRLEADLRRAVKRQEFCLQYQPIVSLGSNRINGFEALVRWQHPKRGLMYPAEFIPMAEETGLIISLGQWVLREACGQMREWQEQYPELADCTMAVNLSSKQLLEATLVEQIKQILEETGLDAKNLMLEITESALMENAQMAATMLTQLREFGVRLSIDDFGTGYSSLSYLHRFHADILKIDRSFISRIDVDQENREITKTILNLAANLAMNVVAEGVETKGQLAQLSALSCQYGQGEYFYASLDSKAVTGLFHKSL